MKVIIAGLSSSGIRSLTEVFRQLGYKVSGYEDQVDLMGDGWLKILSKGGTNEDFQKMFEDVDVVADLPASFLWKEIHDAFPESKIILTQSESADEWLKAMKSQVDAGSSYWLLTYLFCISPTKNRVQRMGNKITQIVFGSSLYETWPFNKPVNETLLRRAYRAHSADVLQNAPAERLLVHQLNQGWKPICDFLNCPIPSIDFPKTEEKSGREIMDELLATSPMFQRMKKEVVFFLSLIVASCGIALYFVPRQFFE